MPTDLTPQSFWGNFPLRSLRSMFDDAMHDEFLGLQRGLSLSEDSEHVYVEAAIPGIDPKRDSVDLTFEDGVLCIVASAAQNEKRDVTFIRRAVRQYTYQVAMPSAVDATEAPTAKAENGILTVTFRKSERAKPRKIPVDS